MNLFNYLEKYGELGNATAALEYFVRRKDVMVNDNVLKAYKVVINNTTSRVGQYSPRKREIELHVELMAAGREEEHRQTLLHEVAHLIQKHVWDLNGKPTTPHGQEWRMVMYKLGIPADRCHKSDWMTEFVANKSKITYACKKCGEEFPTQKLRPKLLRMGVTHRRCGGSFYLKEDRRNGRSYNAVTTPRTRAPIIHILGTVDIKKALYRNKWLKPGTYNVVREFKLKKNEWIKGTITILINGTKYRVTVENSSEWYVR